MTLTTRLARRGMLLGAVAGALLFTAGCDRFGSPHSRAERMMKSGDFEGALQAYNDAIAQQDHLDIAYANRCYVHQELNHDEEAIHDCTESLKLSPDQPEVLNNRGVSYLNMRRYDEAAADFTAAIKLKPDYAEAFANQGRLDISQEEFQLAIDDLTKVIALPGVSEAVLSDAYGNRAMAQQSLGDGEKALADYSEAIKHGGDPQAYFNRAMIYLGMGYFDKSFQDFETVVARADKSSDVYMMSQANLEFLKNRPKLFDPITGATVEPATATAQAAGTATSEAMGTSLPAATDSASSAKATAPAPDSTEDSESPSTSIPGAATTQPEPEATATGMPAPKP